jgi:hypothetical protein
MVALCYALALQAMTGPAAAFAGHGPGGAGEHVLCLGEPGSPPADPAGGPAHDGSCCDLGCLSRSAGLVTPPAVAVVPVDLPRPAAAAGTLWPPGAETGPPPPPETPPQVPRAPPVA